MERYAACTLFASILSQPEADDTNSVIKKTVQFLVENEFVRLQSCGDKERDENKGVNNEEDLRLNEEVCSEEFLLAF